MTVEISYFSAFASGNRPVAKTPQTSESIAITASPVLSALSPDGCEALSVVGTEAFRFEYTLAGGTGATASSHYVPAGERFWLTPHARYKFSLRTA